MGAALERSKLQNFFLIIALGIQNALTPFTIDMYLPAFPEIARDLNVTMAQVGLTISIYFIGFACGQIIYGPLLDRFGRKAPLRVGLIIYVLSTLGCANSTSLSMLIFFRLLSSLGGCVASVSSMAMVRDFFPPSAVAKVLSMLMLVLSASPLLAPSVGSFVVLHASWRAIFYILAGMGVFVFLLSFVALPKDKSADPNTDLNPRAIFNKFKEIYRNPQFFTYTMAGAFSFAGLFVYIAGSPTIFMSGFGVSPQTYGIIFAILASGMIGGGQLNLFLLRKFDGKKIFRNAIKAQLLVGFVFLLGAINNSWSMPATVAILFCVLLCAGIAYPNAASQALAPFTKNIGSAAALLGFHQLGVGALMSAGVSLLEIKGSLPTALVIAFSCTIAFLILKFRKEIASELSTSAS